MDIQFCPDHYAVATYIVSYMCKGNKGLSKVMEQACKDAAEGNKSLMQQIYKISNSFFSSHQTSAQEAVYLLLGLPMRMSSRSVIFVPTGLKKGRNLILKTNDRIKNKRDDDTDVINPTALIAMYESQPRCLSRYCYADFASEFDQSKGYTPKTQDYETPEDIFLNEENDDMEHENNETNKKQKYGPNNSIPKR